MKNPYRIYNNPEDIQKILADEQDDQRRRSVDTGLPTIGVIFAGLNAVYYSGSAVYQMAARDDLVGQKAAELSKGCVPDSQTPSYFQICLTESAIKAAAEVRQNIMNDSGISAAALVAAFAIASGVGLMQKVSAKTFERKVAQLEARYQELV